MKKKIFSIALVALSMLSLPAVAQTSQQSQGTQQTTLCAKGPRNIKAAQFKSRKDPFKDITGLTATQRQQLEKLSVAPCPASAACTGDSCQTKDQCTKQGKGPKHQKGDNGKACKQQKCNKSQCTAQPDSAAVAARFQARKQVRLDYLQQVKQILTPEQYVQFLENTYVSAAPSKATKGHKHHASKSKQGKRDKQAKSQKGDKQRQGKAAKNS